MGFRGWWTFYHPRYLNRATRVLSGYLWSDPEQMIPQSPNYLWF